MPRILFIFTAIILAVGLATCTARSPASSEALPTDTRAKGHSDRDRGTQPPLRTYSAAQRHARAEGHSDSDAHAGADQDTHP